MAEKQSDRTNAMAVASFVLSLCGALLVLPVIGQILGLVFGFMGMSQIKESKEGGKGLALAGVLISAISLVLGLLFILFLIIVAIASADSTY